MGFCCSQPSVASDPAEVPSQLPISDLGQPPNRRYLGSARVSSRYPRSVLPSGQPDRFDVKSFREKMLHGSAYRHRGIELIKFCQYFSVSSEQSYHQYVTLSRVLEKCDRAISLAIQQRDKTTSGVVDYYFTDATRHVAEYDSEFHKSSGNVQATMENAKLMDERNKEEPSDKAAGNNLSIVEFHILGTLPDRHSISVYQALSSSVGDSVLPEILWNFSHLDDNGRLKLAQNPHFYVKHPLSSGAYDVNFRSQPTERYEGKIYVLTNNSRRVFLDVHGKLRTFDNVLVAKRALIFRDVTGRLEGEAIVREAFGVNVGVAPTPFCYRVEPTQGQAGQPEEITDWIEPLRKLDDSTVTHVRISAKTVSMGSSDNGGQMASLARATVPGTTGA